MRASFAALLLLAPGLAAAKSVEGFPRANEIFPPLLADPRAVGISASYYRHRGDDASDLALGRAWGLARWRSGSELRWLWQADVEAMAYSRFKAAGGFETVDLFGALPLTVRNGDVSFKAALFHKSSHLGDDYIRRTGDRGFRYSTKGLRAQAALEPFSVLRLYGGADYLFHAVPAPQSWTLQSGFELTSPDLRRSGTVSLRLFLAEDLQSHQRVGWNADSHTVAGVKIGSRDAPARALRLQLGYFTGHSPFGQFYAQRDHYTDISVALEL